MAKKVVLHEDMCIGCGTCQGISDGNDGGYFVVEDVAKVVKDYDVKDQDIIDEAISMCAGNAIEIVDEK